MVDVQNDWLKLLVSSHVPSQSQAYEICERYFVIENVLWVLILIKSGFLLNTRQQRIWKRVGMILGKLWKEFKGQAHSDSSWNEQ